MKFVVNTFCFFILVSFIQLSIATGEKPSKKKNNAQTTRTISAPLKAKWHVDGSTLKLEEGTSVKQSIELYERSGLEPVDVPGDPEAKIRWINESKVTISKNQEFIVHTLRQSKNEGEDLIESSSVARGLNKKGDVAWEIKSIASDVPIRISSDGSRAAIVVSNIDGCSAELDQRCTKTARVINSSNGKTLIEFGPYHSIFHIELTENGKYGYISAWPGSESEPGNVMIFFDLDKKKHLIKQDSFFSEGSPEIKEDGSVEIRRLYYEGVPPNRKVVRSELIKKFNIE